MSSKAQQLFAEGREGDIVEIDGTSFEVKPLTPSEINAVHSATGATVNARLLFYAVWDPDTGERVFDDSHIEKIAKEVSVAPGGWYDTLLTKAYEEIGVDPEDLQEEGAAVKALRKIDGFMSDLAEAVQYDHVDDDVAADIQEVAENTQTVCQTALEKVESNREDRENPTASSPE